ncbi:MAG: hypothetical protein OQL28_00490 [Sedimenticola sp.]|nr:hypothetical protein [Sedimenticola sp.]
MRILDNLRELARPREANWFELYVPRDQTVYAIEALAGTGEVQLEPSVRQASHLHVENIRRALIELDDYCKLRQLALPDFRSVPSRLLSSPEAAAEEALSYVRRWGERLTSLQEKMHALQQEKENLQQLQKLLDALHDDDSGIELFSHHGDFLCKGVYACPLSKQLPPDLKEVVTRTLVQGDTAFFLFAALPDRQSVIEQLLDQTSCVEVEIPDWLPSGRSAQEQVIAERLGTIERLYREAQHGIELHWASTRLKEVLANAAVLRWFVDHAADISEHGRYCHVTGWSTLDRADSVESVLEKANIHAIVRHPMPPLTTLPPVRILETWWSRPFHLFQAFSGTPGSKEVDPSFIIPIVVPLLFGFMFPDVGHGLILLLIGMILGTRLRTIRFLIPCGVSSMFFGILFGDLFGVGGLLPALWFRPLDDPLRIFGVALFFGFGLILTGMMFSAIEARWRGLLSEWFARDAPITGLYIAAAVGVFFNVALLAMPFLLAWYLAGSTWIQYRHGKVAFSTTLGNLLQTVFELLLNSFSFIRVGAFALAHAGLTITVSTLAEQFDNPVGYLVTLVLGHLLVICIEGLIVFIQTTRLVFFEFFIRFLRAEGRPLKPLVLPG